MRHKLTRPPRHGERQLYRDRIEWRWYQKHLPPDLRLGESELPSEQWWQYRNHDIHIDRYPAETPRATLILLHGGGGNGRALAPFARMVSGNNIEVVAPDLPGYGLTVRSRALKPSYALWTDVVDRLIEAERKRAQVPVVLWGLSLGGLLAYMAAARNKRVAGLIATTLVDTRKLSSMARIGRNALVGGGGAAMMKLVGPLLDWIRVPMPLMAPMRLISNDPETSAVFARDRIAGGSTVRIGFLRSLMNLTFDIEPEQFDVCPVLLAHPALDPWTPVELSRPLFDRIAAPKELVMLEGCGHFPVEEPGRRQLQRAVVRFLDDIA